MFDCFNDWKEYLRLLSSLKVDDFIHRKLRSSLKVYDFIHRKPFFFFFFSLIPGNFQTYNALAINVIGIE